MPTRGRVLESVRLHAHVQESYHGEPIGEVLDYGATLDAEDYGLPTTDAEFFEFHNIGGRHLVAERPGRRRPMRRARPSCSSASG